LGTAGAIIIGQMLFLLLKQQCQSNEGSK